ncbi:MAG TPA: ATP-binding protein [Trueperaceae bacterium]
MDPVRNPFAPGAGSQPPELAGRDEILARATTTLRRVSAGKHARSLVLLGLRGSGKTVLLNRFELLAEQEGHLTAFIEAPEDGSLAELLYPRIHQVLRKLSVIEKARASAHRALRVLRAFASAFELSVGEVTISVDPEPGTADSGILEYDLSELLVRVGEAAASAQRGVTLLVDEIQYLSTEELSALIVAIHRLNQRRLPIILLGAGLPQVAGLSGNAKSYAERLFDFTAIGALDAAAAAEAIREPLADEGESITDDALQMIVERTRGYPYFLQEWGFQAWNAANDSPIGVADVELASERAVERLDEGFFRVRFDRLTPKEREYVIAMARSGDGPYRSSEVAQALGQSVQSLGPRRAKLIRKGMIYSPAHGDIAFTVPMFEDFLRRTVRPPRADP